MPAASARLGSKLDGDRIDYFLRGLGNLYTVPTCIRPNVYYHSLTKRAGLPVKAMQSEPYGDYHNAHHADDIRATYAAVETDTAFDLHKRMPKPLFSLQILA